MKKAVRAALVILLLLILLVGIYAAYVFLTWYRVEDNQTLEVDTVGGGTEADLTTGERYRIASYNIGFGAYNADYSFFMDGGVSSRALSPDAVRENVGGAVEAVKSLQQQLLFL